MNKFLKDYFLAIKKLLPEKADSTSVGVDIGTQSCKLVELRKKEGIFELLNWRIEPVKKGDISATLKKMFEQFDFSNKSLYTSILGKGTLIRFIDMPQMTDDELKSSFSLEAEKYFPFDLDQIYTDCTIVDHKLKQKRMPVLVAAAKKELVDRRIGLLTQLGCQIDFVGFNILALANVISFTKNETEDFESSLAVLEIEDQVSSLMITTNKMPCFIRDIFIGFSDMKESIGSTLGKEAAEVDKLISDVNIKSEEIVSACDVAVENIVKELRMSFDYFSTEGNKDVKEIMLFGEITKYTKLIEAIERNLEVKVIKWDSQKAITLSLDIDEEEFKNNSNQLGVAIGLALNDYV